MKNATYVSSTETLRQRYIFPSSLAHWAICSIISEYKTQPEKHTQEAEVLSSSLQPVKSLPDRWYPGQKKKKTADHLLLLLLMLTAVITVLTEGNSYVPINIFITSEPFSHLNLSSRTERRLKQNNETKIGFWKERVNTSSAIPAEIKPLYSCRDLYPTLPRAPKNNFM